MHSRNEILAAVPGPELAPLSERLELVRYCVGDVLIDAHAAPGFVFFPESLIASIVAIPAHERIEAASVGRGGFLGYPAVLGTPTFTQTVVQMEGETWRVNADAFAEVLPRMPTLRAVLSCSIMAVLDEISLTAACNAAHSLVSRCAKCLLLVRERSGADDFTLTHRALATMLGVRRAGVTVALGALQKAGMVHYHRGRVRITDRGALERSSCKCYGLINLLEQARREAMTRAVKSVPLRTASVV